jgi:hypothetical protein
MQTSSGLQCELLIDAYHSFRAMAKNKKGEVRGELHLFTQEISPVFSKQLALLLELFDKGKKESGMHPLFFCQ